MDGMDGCERVQIEIDGQGHKFRENVAKFSNNGEISPILHLKSVAEPR